MLPWLSQQMRNQRLPVEVKNTFQRNFIRFGGLSLADGDTFLCSVLPLQPSLFVSIPICSAVQEVYSEIETLTKDREV